ncbi:MAG TPA: hypothetical protein VKB77_17125 [Terriglobales bacterium]|nr:hypothetical protein [Terriglobales bacterium]
MAAVTAYLLGAQRGKVAWLALVSFHAHLLEDLMGSRGPDGYTWPIPYFMRFHELGTELAWAVDAERLPNFAITAALLVATFYLA